MDTKKVYRIYDNFNKEYLTLGSNSKTTWNVFPSGIIKSLAGMDQTNWVVEEFEYELVKKNKYDIKRKRI